MIFEIAKLLSTEGIISSLHNVKDTSQGFLQSLTQTRGVDG